MSISLGRLASTPASDKNQTFDIIAAIPTRTVSNGHTEWIVTGWDMYRNEYATWRMGWVYSDDDESTRTYSKCYSSGNYFRQSLTCPDAREKALSDMVIRAGLLPTINGTADLDIPPHKPQFGEGLADLADWEIALLWPAEYTSGIYYLTTGQKRAIYDSIRGCRKITAIKDYRTFAGRTGERANMGLKEAKDAVEAVEARFRQIEEEGPEATQAANDSWSGNSDYCDCGSCCGNRNCGACHPF